MLKTAKDGKDVCVSITHLILSACMSTRYRLHGWMAPMMCIKSDFYTFRTPLHCAAGFTHLPAMHLLLQNGASLYLQTSDDQYPIDLVREASEADEDDMDAQNCYHYLRDCWQGLGKIKERKVYALFNYVATSNDELSFITGEELIVMHREDDLDWWIVENSQGIKGFVPSTFLGLYPRRQIVLWHALNANNNDNNNNNDNIIVIIIKILNSIGV